MDPPEQRRENSRQEQENDDGGEEREELGPLPEGPDEERFDPAGDPPHGEVDRDLGQEESKAEHAENEGDDQRPASRDRSGGKAMPWKPAEESGYRLQRGDHGGRTRSASFEPMPAL